MPIMTNNNTANRIANDTIKQQRSRAIDMRFYWLKDQFKQGHFQVFWKPCDEIKGDYHTWHHPVMHHKNVCRQYLHTEANCLVSSMQWVNPTDL
eukprot:7501940-Ditylum_brightwellii.AAC.1